MVVRHPITRVLVLVATIALGGTASADDNALAKARAAVAGVRYDEAQVLLVDALRTGGHSPDEVAEIYRLSASTAVVLGQSDVAEQYYRRWLALVPTATLPDSVAPKLRQPFVAAQAYMAAHGHLSVKTVRRDDVIEVAVDGDVLGMVASVALGDGAPHAVGADRIVRLEHAHAAAVPDVIVLDEFGNRLLVLDGAAIPRSETGATTPSPASQDVPVYRRPIVWASVAVGFAIVGTVFGVRARSAQNDVETIAASPLDHFASELDDARSRRDGSALVANISFVGAAACAVSAAVLWATRPSSAVAVVPSNQGVTVVMSRAF